MYKDQKELFNILSGAFNVKLRLINKEYNYIKINGVKIKIYHCQKWIMI